MTICNIFTKCADTFVVKLIKLAIQRWVSAGSVTIKVQVIGSEGCLSDWCCLIKDKNCILSNYLKQKNFKVSTSWRHQLFVKHGISSLSNINMHSDKHFVYMYNISNH